MDRIVTKCDKCGDIGACKRGPNLIHRVNNCNGNLIETSMPHADFWILCDISDDNDFLQAMIDLREKDIIEYQVKMSQFRTQVQLQKNAKRKEYNYPKCPTCGSTNIRKISVASKIRTRALLGVYALGRTSKTFQCIHCGYEW